MQQRETRQRHFQEKAKEAEEKALALKDNPDARARWLQIAESYRHLAATT